MIEHSQVSTSTCGPLLPAAPYPIINLGTAVSALARHGGPLAAGWWDVQTFPTRRRMDTKATDTGATEAPLARRAFVKATLYVTPAILTLRAAPSFASYGSGPAPSGAGTYSPPDKAKPFDPPRGRDNAPGQLKKLENQTSHPQPNGPKDSNSGSKQSNSGSKHSK